MTKEAAAEGDYVNMTCEVTYNGKWVPTPTLRWKNFRWDRLYRTTSDRVVRAENATEGNRLTATQVIELTPAHNRGRFSCKVFFETLALSTSCYTGNFYVYCKYQLRYFPFSCMHILPIIPNNANNNVSIYNARSGALYTCNRNFQL